MICSQPKWNGHDQNELVSSKLWFSTKMNQIWTWPIHFGRDHLILVMTKSLWSSPNQFGQTKSILDQPKLFWSHRRTRQQYVAVCKQWNWTNFLISGNEGAISENGSEVFTAFDKSIFEEAKKLGINRTVHAGEDGPSENVRIAVEEMFAQRIGHGYRVMQDKELYRKCRYKF